MSIIYPYLNVPRRFIEISPQYNLGHIFSLKNSFVGAYFQYLNIFHKSSQVKLESTHISIPSILLHFK